MTFERWHDNSLFSVLRRLLVGLQLCRSLNEPRVRPIPCSSDVWSLTRRHSFTSASERAVVRPLFLKENSFHRRRHRKVATRQTLPKIQTSLSCRRFSMTGCFLLHLRMSGRWSCLSLQLIWCWTRNKAQLSPACFLLISRAWVPELSVSHNRLVQRFSFSAASLPKQPSTQLPPYLPPRDLKGENILSLRQDRDRWCWVLGIAAAQRIRCPLLVLLACEWDHPVYPLTSDAAFHACLRAPRCTCEAAALLP